MVLSSLRNSDAVLLTRAKKLHEMSGGVGSAMRRNAAFASDLNESIAVSPQSDKRPLRPRSSQMRSSSSEVDIKNMAAKDDAHTSAFLSPPYR